MRNRRSRSVSFAIAATVATALAGCADDPDPDHQAICIDEQTQRRVDDEDCARSSGSSVWI